MIKKLPKENMGKSNLGWLKSRFHFSFAEYRNPNNINFGVLRVLNDDLVEAKTGFEMHPHENMEIISYIFDCTIGPTDKLSLFQIPLGSLSGLLYLSFASEARGNPLQIALSISLA